MVAYKEPQPDDTLWIETKHGKYSIKDCGLWLTLNFPEETYNSTNPIPKEELPYRCGFIQLTRNKSDYSICLYSHLLLPKDYFGHPERYENQDFTIHCFTKIQLLMEMAAHNIMVDMEVLNRFFEFC